MNWDAGKILRQIGRSLPLVGPLAYCTRRNHFDAIKEFTVATLFGTATFWVTAIILQYFKANDGKTYFELFYLTTNAGQLFVFAVGMFGPIVISAADEPDSVKKFPGRTSHFTIMLFLGIVASALYALQIAARDPQMKEMLHTDWLFASSVAIASLVLALRYLTLVYRKSTVTFSPERDMLDPTKSFAETFGNRHGALK